MKVELKNIHHDERMSEETNCYSAVLYVDGKKVGTVSNHGHGGCDDAHIDPKSGWTFETLNDAIKASHPKWKSQYDGAMNDTDLEILCGELVGEFLMEKDFRKQIKSRILIDDPKGVLAVSFKGVRTVSKELIDRWLAKNPNRVGKVLNLMSEADALAIWKRNPNG